MIRWTAQSLHALRSRVSPSSETAESHLHPQPDRRANILPPLAILKEKLREKSVAAGVTRPLHGKPQQGGRGADAQLLLEVCATGLDRFDADAGRSPGAPDGGLAAAFGQAARRAALERRHRRGGGGLTPLDAESAAGENGHLPGNHPSLAACERLAERMGGTLSLGPGVIGPGPHRNPSAGDAPGSGRAGRRRPRRAPDGPSPPTPSPR